MNATVSASGCADWPDHAGQPPFVHVRMADGRMQLDGRPDCTLGSPQFNPATNQLEGVFARWHHSDSNLTAEVDPLGMFSLFYWQSGDQLMLSPSILQLIAQGADTTRDDRALSVFLRLGLFLNQDTPFRNIKVLPPGGRLSWSNGTTTLTGTTWPAAEQQITRDAAVDGIVDLPRDSLQHFLGTRPGDLVLPLSGGRDSRHILLDLAHLGQPPVACATFQQPSDTLNSEARAARAICERLGVRHDILDRPRQGSRDLLRCLTLTSLCSDEHLQMMPMHDYLAGHSWTALDGIAGDILTNPDDAAEGHYRRAQAGDFHAIATEMMAGHARVIRKPGVAPAACAIGTTEEATAYLADTIATHADAPDPYQSFWFWHRTRREIGFVPSALFASAGAVFCPYLDTRFVRFCLSLPYAVTRDQHLHNDAIARAYPDMAGVAYGDAFATPPPPRVSVPAKLDRALSGIRTLLALAPEHPLSEIGQFLRGSPELLRRPGEVFQMYRLILSGIDAEFARRVLRTAADYTRAADPNQVTRSFIPGDM